MDNERKIFWLASYPKSGNTWVRFFLDTYVTGFPVKFSSAYRYVQVDHDCAAMQSVCAKPITEMSLVDQIIYQPAALANMIVSAKTKDIVMKTHNAKAVAAGMPLIPTHLSAGAIYLIRDPRDVVLSYASHLGISFDNAVKVMADENHAAHSQINKLYHLMSSWSTHVSSWTKQNKDIPVTVIKYEDLLLQPEIMFRKILGALGIAPINKKAFKFALGQTQFSVLQDVEEKHGFIERSPSSKDKFFRVGKAGQWKTKLTKQYLRIGS